MKVFPCNDGGSSHVLSYIGVRVVAIYTHTLRVYYFLYYSDVDVLFRKNSVSIPTRVGDLMPFIFILAILIMCVLLAGRGCIELFCGL